MDTACRNQIDAQNIYVKARNYDDFMVVGYKLLKIIKILKNHKIFTQIMNKLRGGVNGRVNGSFFLVF